MRKDFITFGKNNDTELNFIENYWSKVWEKKDFKNLTKRVYKQEEYKLIKPFLNKLNSKSKLLDGGCGLGDWVIALKSNGYDISGIDISQKTIDKLKIKFSDINFLRGDIRNTNFPENHFDIYFSWGVFEHFEEGPNKCIKEAKRILKKNGKLFISVPFDNLRHSIESNVIRNLNFSKKDRFYQYRFSSSEIYRELKKEGFEIIVLKPIHKRQGLLRMLHHNFGMKYEWFLTKVMALLLTPFIPRILVGHMIFAGAIKK